MIDDLKTKGNVDVSRTVAAIDQEIARLSSLKSKGVNQAIEILNDWRGSVRGKTVVKGADGNETIINEGQNLENIAQLRKFLGQSFEDSNLASVKQLGQESLNRIYAPLREDMRSFIQNFGNKNDIKKRTRRISFSKN